MKVLITLPTFAPSLDGPQHLDTHELVDVEPDTAKALVVAGKALFVDKKDDFTAHKVKTATDKQLEAATEARAAAAAAAKATAKKSDKAEA